MYRASRAIGDIQCLVLKELQCDGLREHHVSNGSRPRGAKQREDTHRPELSSK
jgi:hypothetical protein